MTLQIHLLPGFSCLADMVTMRRGFLYLLSFIYESSLKERFLDVIKDLIFSVIQCYYCHYYCYLRALWNADDFKCKLLVMSLLRYEFFVFMTFANHTLLVKFFCQHPKYIQKRKRNVIFCDFFIQWFCHSVYTKHIKMQPENYFDYLQNNN